MRSRLTLIVAAILVSGNAAGQAIDCPDVDFTTEVGARVVTLRWSDSPESLRTKVDLSLRKISKFLPGDDSIAWRGTSLPSVGGTYTGRCDFVYTLRSFNNVVNFSTVDTARVSPAWTGTSLPTSGGTFRSCVDSRPFLFTLLDGGAITSSGGAAIRVAWADTISLSDTLVVPATYVAGTLLGVHGGLAVSFTAGNLVAGDTFTIRTRVPSPALLDCARAFPGSDIAENCAQFEICRPDTAIALENGLTLTLSPGDLFEYSFDSGDSVGVFRVTAQAYDGYRVWRSDIRNLSDLTLIREFTLCKDADSTFFTGADRVYVDAEVHNGFPYRYAVTCFDTLSATESALEPTATLYPRTDPASSPGAIGVVPNPYTRRVAWEEAGESKLQFTSVPAGSTIRIYTSSGSLVREIGPDEVARGCSATTLPGCVNWDLRNGRGEDIVSGIYIFQVDSPGRDGHVGKFMVAR